MCDVPSRLSSKIRVTEFVTPGLPTPCCEWTGAVDHGHHGRIKIGGRTLHVWRVVVEARGETLDPDEHVIALCGYPCCVNSDHLVFGTADEAHALGQHGHIGVGDLLLAKQLIEDGETSADQVAEFWDVGERLLTSAMARCRWDGPFLKKAS
jgi:hypothetical protein